jgi:cytochrome c-type biogenesis protein CcmF
MIPELGHFALTLALGMALIQAVLPLAGAALARPAWMALARPAAAGQMVFVTIALLALSWSFYANDFSVAYVAHNSNTELPWYYRLSAVWGAHEGSLLLWSVFLAGWTVAVAAASRSLPAVFSARVIAVMGLVSVGFLLFMLITSNPFERLFPVPLQGRDLNPLLQDFGLIVHPPMLYMGYVGFSVAFAFAIAALLGGSLDAAWARWSRPWTTVAWLFLTLGITLGSWWAYYELGWGGWWFWDPVENASFMPWLVGTALIHSLAVTEKRGAFKSWTVLLAIMAFSLSLLGAFLVRSGVLNSVHSFASDPGRGVFSLGLLVLAVGGSLLLYALRAPRVSAPVRFGTVSRESLLLINNVLLSVAAATVLLGTLYPLLMDALGLGSISVGEPYFNAVFIPLMLPLAMLTAIGGLARWKQDRLARVVWSLRWGVIAAGALGVLCAWVVDGISWMAALGIAVALWVVWSSLQILSERVAQRRDKLAALRGTSRGVWGMVLAHFGLGVFIAGVTVVSTLDVERDVRMAPGDSLTIAGYTYRFDGTRQAQGPNYDAIEGVIAIFKENRPVTVLYPQKRTYRVQQNPMTEAGIEPGLFRDLYVALGDPLGGGAWSVRLQYKPMVRWIWLGGLLMALGGLLAATDPRYRRLAARQQRPTMASAKPEQAAPAVLAKEGAQ